MTRGPAPAPHPDDLDEEIIDAATSCRFRSLRSMAEDVGVSYQTVKRRLAILERQGLIERGPTGQITRSVAKAPDVTL